MSKTQPVGRIGAKLASFTNLRLCQMDASLFLPRARARSRAHRHDSAYKVIVIDELKLLRVQWMGYCRLGIERSPTQWNFIHFDSSFLFLFFQFKAIIMSTMSTYLFPFCGESPKWRSSSLVIRHETSLNVICMRPHLHSLFNGA